MYWYRFKQNTVWFQGLNIDDQINRFKTLTYMYKHVLYILLKIGNCVWYRASIRHVYVRRMLGTI